jgi:hypothetical protein
VSERAAWTVLGAAVVALLLGVASVDLAELSQDAFWSDGATYTTMALSLAEDGDLRYEARDALRIRRLFGHGPQGIFLKRSSGGLTADEVSGFPWLRRVTPEEGRVYFAKAAAYPIAAAPLVRLFGANGLLLTNAVFLAGAMLFGFVEARRLAPPGRALVLTLAIFLGGVTPLYLLWPQPEIFNVGVIVVALWAWRRDRPWLSAVLFGIATYSKPTNLFLALPLGVSPLLVRSLRELGWGLWTSVRRGLVLAAVTLAFYGANVLVTGEWNYQGGERKTFHGPVFPFEAAGVTFGNSGFWMTTNRVGPAVEGDEQQLSRGEAALSAEELRGAFLANLGYFWYGRYGGALPYFPTVVLAVAAFLLLGPRAAPGWLALAALCVSWLFYIWLIPANWYGGGGTVGNRYFLNLVPLALYLVPKGREWAVSLAGSGLAVWALWPIAAAPMTHTLHPGWHAMRAPFTLLPAELSMLNDLSFNIEAWRKKQSIGDTGDHGKGWPAERNAYWLYFPDNGTWGREDVDGHLGFRIKPGQRTEVLLRTQAPARWIEIRVSGLGPGESVGVELGGESRALAAAAGASAVTRLEPGPGFIYYNSWVYPLRLRMASRPAPEGRREEAPFVRLVIEAGPQPSEVPRQ